MIVMKVGTDIITSIAASPIERTVILVIIFMYVELFTIDIYTKGQIILFYDYMKKNLFIVFF
jgi:hypothetical protein